MAPGGYLWWYLDALSDDGRHGFTAIAFIGSVFSPYYARARRGGRVADPTQHVALNLAVYGEGGHHWAMTERGRGALDRQALRLRIGPSVLAWEGDDLVLRFDEWTAPWPRRLRGELRLSPGPCHAQRHALDAAGRHQWWPIAPQARACLTLAQPALRWQGHAYLDANLGSEPLADAFHGWHWSRHRLADGSSAVFYDAQRQDGGRTALALHFGTDGRQQALPLPPARALAPSRWGLARSTCAGEGAQADRVVEDTPFYARATLQGQLLGQAAQGVHESLSLARFTAPWVQAMLPFRMPRRGG